MNEATDTTIHSWLESRIGWLVAACAILFSYFVVFMPERSDILLALLLTGSIAAIVMLTRPLDSDADVNVIFRLAYGFVLAILIGSWVLLIVPEIVAPAVKNLTDQAQPDETKTIDRKPGTPAPGNANGNSAATGHRSARTWHIIAVLPGCDYATPKSGDPEISTQDATPIVAEGAQLRGPEPRMPPNAYCGDLPPQWVLSIGGSVLNCHVDGTCPLRTNPAHGEPPVEVDQKKSDLLAKKHELNKAYADRSQAKKDKKLRASLNNINPEEPSVRSLDTLNSDIESYDGTIRSALAEIARLEGEIRAFEEWSKLPRNIEANPIMGGIVLPLYFIVLAWLGSLVSMVRKLPEFQRRVSQQYRTEYSLSADSSAPPDPPVSGAEARELVLFQLLQVLTAPFIAIVAYSWARPEEVANTALLGFAAGFSSETILMALRGAVDLLVKRDTRNIRTRAAFRRPTVMPRGPAPDEPTPPANSKFKVGDEVILLQNVGPAMAGARGTVISIDASGELVVRTSLDHLGNPLRFRLQPQGPEFFRRVGDTDEDDDGAVG